jgi:PAS domain S-box-containing protein
MPTNLRVGGESMDTHHSYSTPGAITAVALGLVGLLVTGMDVADGPRLAAAGLSFVALAAAALLLLPRVLGSGRALAAARERERQLFVTLDDGVLVLDGAGRVLRANPGAQRLLGRPEAQLRGVGFGSLLTPTARERWEAREPALFLEVERPDGAAAPCDARVAPLPQRQTLVVLRDATERKRLVALLNERDELREANTALRDGMTQAEQSALAKSEFLANMSHEIRTPLTAILGFAELLQEEGDVRRAPGGRLDALATIQRNGGHLLSLINDILDLSRIESGRLAIENVRFSLPDLVAEVAELMRVRADAKGIPLRVNFTTPIPARLSGDPTRIRQVLINLVGNAIKFTEVGEVRLDLALEASGGNHTLVVSVADTGIGMTPEVLARAFRPFRQADSSTTRRFGGSGLGLAISERLCSLMGGSLEARSVPGEGSTFSFRLPVGSLRDVPLVAQPLQPATAASPARSELPRLRGRVLLAEDGPDNRRLLSTLLARAGLLVEVAENGHVAVERVRAAAEEGAPFDLVVMDMQMPVMDGYTAVRTLRQEGFPVAVIALTAHAMRGERERCLASGCDEFASKPIDRADLFAKLARFLPSAKPEPEGAQ